MNKKRYFFIIVVIIMAVAAAYFYLTKFYFPDKEKEKIYTAADFPEAAKIMDPEILRLTLEDLNKQYQKIEENSYVYIRWINIGILRKRLEDYTGAEKAWLEAVSYNPDQALAYGNLADLYLYELREYEKSEAYYKKVLTMQPDVYNHYFGLASLYRYNMTEKANSIEDLMNDGANLNPPREAATFYMYLANYFDDGPENHGGNDKEKAKHYTKKASELNPDLKDQLPDL